jgi:hypothetical protein
MNEQQQDWTIILRVVQKVKATTSDIAVGYARGQLTEAGFTTAEGSHAFREEETP